MLNSTLEWRRVSLGAAKMKTCATLIIILAVNEINFPASSFTPTSEPPKTPGTTPGCDRKEQSTQNGASLSNTESGQDPSLVTTDNSKTFTTKRQASTPNQAHTLKPEGSTAKSLLKPGNQSASMSDRSKTSTCRPYESSTSKEGISTRMSVSSIKQIRTPVTTPAVETSSLWPKSLEEEANNDRNPMSDLRQESEHVKLQLNVTAPYCASSFCDETGSPAGNCYCDESCYLYSDCCYDMINKLTKEMGNETRSIKDLVQAKVEELENKTLMLKKELISCIGDVNNASAFIMVSSCDGSASTDYTEKCELSSNFYSVDNIPVDHIVNHEVLATFKNIYCALCNEISQNELLFWEVDIACDREDKETISEMELHEIAALKECVLSLHSLVETKLRHCFKAFPPILCPLNTTTEVIDLCNNYIYPLRSENNAQLMYKNPHCAVCTNSSLNVSYLNCVEIYKGKHNPEFIGKAVDLKVLFDFSLGSGIVSKMKCGHELPCKHYEVYDCVSRRCRHLYCPVGEVPRNGECLKTTENVTVFVTDATKPVDLSATRTSIKNTSIFIVELMDDKELQTVAYALGSTTDRIFNMIYDILLRHREYISIIGELEECKCIVIERSEESIDVNIIKDVLPLLEMSFNLLEEKENRGYTLIPLFITVRNFKTLDSLECVNGKMFVEKSPSIVESNSSLAFALRSTGIIVQEENCVWELRYNKTTGVYSSVIATCLLHSISGPHLNCSMVAYDLGEVIITNNSVTMINASFTVYEDDFVVFNNKVYICSDLVTDIDNFLNIFLYSASHRILSVVTSSVSVISAVVIITVHCCSKRLRNIHGLNISALSVSILSIHLLLILQIYQITNTLCIVYATVLHLILLNSFVWTNIIGYDMTRIFVSDKMLAQSSPFKRFLRYLFISILIPILIITVAVALDFTDSGWKPGYGSRNICWLSNGQSILVFVIGPVMLSLFLNCSFFTFTVIGICRKLRQTKFARKSSNTSYFVVYLKLTIVLGLTWIIGIVSAFLKQEWFWVVHIVFNGLQGLSLLICSVINARNVRQLKSSMKSSTSNSNGTLSGAYASQNTKI